MSSGFVVDVLMVLFLVAFNIVVVATHGLCATELAGRVVAAPGLLVSHAALPAARVLLLGALKALFAALQKFGVLTLEAAGGLPIAPSFG